MTRLRSWGWEGRRGKREEEKKGREAVVGKKKGGKADVAQVEKTPLVGFFAISYTWGRVGRFGFGFGSGLGSSSSSGPVWV